nr:ribonuclease H-like domain-containing protein [Tanacetum cinerariifolium]
MVTRAKAGIFKPLKRINCHVTTTSPLPRSHVHALRGPNQKEAMLAEYNALITNGTWVLVPRPANVNVIINSLHIEFAMTDLGSLNYFLGISAQRSASGLFLSQLKFAEKVLERAHMQHCNLCKTLIDTKSKLGSDGDPQICLYMHDSRDPHFSALKHILRYVLLTTNHGLQLHVSSTSQITADTDVNWASFPVTCRSHCLVLVLKQNIEVLRMLLLRLCGFEFCCLSFMLLSIATLVNCDNISDVYLSTNPVQHQHTKHIDIYIHFVRGYVASRQVRVLHVPSRFQYADFFTKGLPT